MDKFEFMGLFLIDDSEFDEITVNKNMTLLKKKYREAVKVYHPDNGVGDAALFEKLKMAYDGIRLSGIDDIVDRAPTQKIYFEISEFQKNGVDTLKDTKGNIHKRKEVVGLDNIYVVMRLRLTIDSYEYLFEVSEPYRLDNKYKLELRPPVDKVRWLEQKEHRLILKFENTMDNKETKFNWAGNIKELNFFHSEYRANLNAKISIQLTVPDMT